MHDSVFTKIFVMSHHFFLTEKKVYWKVLTPCPSPEGHTYTQQCVRALGSSPVLLPERWEGRGGEWRGLGTSCLLHLSQAD